MIFVPFFFLLLANTPCGLPRTIFPVVSSPSEADISVNDPSLGEEILLDGSASNAHFSRDLPETENSDQNPDSPASRDRKEPSPESRDSKEAYRDLVLAEYEYLARLQERVNLTENDIMDFALWMNLQRSDLAKEGANFVRSEPIVDVEEDGNFTVTPPERPASAPPFRLD